MNLKNIITLITATILTSSVCIAASNDTSASKQNIKAEIEQTTTQENSSVEVIDPWARPSNPGINNSAAYFEIRNNSDQEINLKTVSSDVANTVELHNSYVDEKGVSKMAKVDKLVIPAKGNITLKPGGIHIMLLDLKDKLEVGKKFDLFLNFDNGTYKKVTVEIKNTK